MNRHFTVRLADVAEIERSGVAPSDIVAGTTYVGLEHIAAGGSSVSRSTVGAGELGSTKFRFTGEHILYGKLRPYLAKIVAPDFSGICSTDILPIRPGPQIDKAFLLHYLRLPENVAWASSRATGVNLPRLSPGELADLSVPLPPVGEQRRIAAILDKADALRQKRKRTIALLDSLTQSIFFEMFGDLVTNSKSWTTVGIEHVCSEIVDCVNRTAPLSPVSTPFRMIRTTNVRGGYVDVENVRFVDEETFLRWNRRLTPRQGDVLLTREAPVGEAGMLRSDVPVFLGQRIMLYRANPNLISPEFLLSSFLDKYLRAQFDRLASGSTVKHLPLPACRSFSLRLPPIELQRDFSRRLTRLIELAKQLLDSAQAIEQHFGSLQHRAFSGQL